MSTRQAKLQRLRVVSAVFVVLNVISIVAMILFNSVAQPAERLRRDHSTPTIIRGVKRALSSHPFGSMLVPYEYNDMKRFIARADGGELISREKARDIAGSSNVYHIVLGEMTLLMIGLFVGGLIGSVLSYFNKAIVGGILMLLCAPIPIFSVGPQAAVLSSYLIAGGILVLMLRPRAEKKKLEGHTSEWTGADRRREGLLTMVAGLAGLVIGGLVTGISIAVAGSGGTYIIATGAFGFGFVAFMVGLVNWLRHGGG